MEEEFKEKNAEEYESDPNLKYELSKGLQGYKSAEADYFLEHSEKYPLTLVLFYDSFLFQEKIMQKLAQRLLEIFEYKFEKKL